MSDASPPVLQPEPFEPAIVDTSGRRYALVWDDAWLYDYPKKPARERAAELPEGRQDPGTATAPFRVVAHWSTQWREVERDPTETWPRCTTGAPPTRPYKRQYYVNEADLVPLTAAPVALTFADGTALRLSAGVPLTPAGERRRVRVDGLDFEVAVPTELVDLAYVPSTPFPAAPERLALAPDEAGVLGTLDGQPVRVEPGTSWWLAGYSEERATLRSPCAELTLQVDRARVSTPGLHTLTGKPR